MMSSASPGFCVMAQIGRARMGGDGAGQKSMAPDVFPLPVTPFTSVPRRLSRTVYGVPSG